MRRVVTLGAEREGERKRVGYASDKARGGQRWHGVARRGVARRGVARRGAAWHSISHSGRNVPVKLSRPKLVELLSARDIFVEELAYTMGSALPSGGRWRCISERRASRKGRELSGWAG